ncbi:MAG: LPS export ABC transporter permease LptF [gamma proteobacterium symbiont of Taylorina sp.]|nr:LPS export ABC transporter permease LptF [gamma proteobacterium symbiont of Taylorina sp.]
MIIQDYIIKEILRSFAGVFIVLFLVILSTQLLKSLSAVASGQISTDFLFALIAYKNIDSLTIILPLSLFVSILLALSRLYKDSEMIALSSCGIGPLSLLKSVLIVVSTFIFLEAGLSLSLGPWARSHIQIAKEEFKVQAVVEFIVAGQFNFSNDLKRVLYTERFNDKKTSLDNVFLYIDKSDKKNEGGDNSVLASEKASFVTDPKNDSRYIIFNNGHRYDGIPGTFDYTHIRFQDYGVLLQGKSVSNISFDRESVPFSHLLDTDKINYKAEFQWRISQILMMIILAMLAVPLSKSTPRQGRYGKMAVAILIYIIYSNLLLVSMNMLRKGRVDPFIGMWWVHVIFILLFLFLFSRQMGWLQIFKQKKQNEFEDLVNS